MTTTQPVPLGEHWLHAVLMAVDEAIVGTSAQDTIVVWNYGAQRLLGYSAPEIIGHPRSLLSVSGEGNLGRRWNEQVAPGSARNTGWRHKDGSIRSVTVSLSPVFDAAGQFSGIIEIARARDIIGAPREADPIMMEADEQNLPRQEAAALSDSTVARLTHELSEPITALHNYLLAAERLLSSDRQLDTVKIQAAITAALTQMSRATVVLRQLRNFGPRPGGA